MTREIKFKFWNGTCFLDEMYLDLNSLKENTANAYQCWRDLEDALPDKITLLQYTGLKDKNGVEIYEGDIVNLYNWSYKSKELLGTSYIVFDEDEGGWKTEKTIIEDQYDFYKKAVFEVIGSIYQNPELINP